jgi:hypothetical protein
MKKSQLVQIIKEELSNKVKAKNTIKEGMDSAIEKLVKNDDASEMIALIKGLPDAARKKLAQMFKIELQEEGDPVRGNKILDKANPDNVARITRGEKPIYEGEGKLYSKQQAIEYIENNPPAKYYKIGISQGTSQQATSIEGAISILTKSPISQFKLTTYGDVIQFSAPFDQKHADLVRSMGSLD